MDAVPFDEVDASSWVFAPGHRRVAVQCSAQDARPPVLQLVRDGDARLRVPFGITTWQGDGQRQDLAFRLDTPALVTFFETLHAYVAGRAAAGGAAWFGDGAAREGRPCVVPQRGAPLLRTRAGDGLRVWRASPRGPGCWSYAPGSPTDIEAGAECWANVVVAGVYVQERHWGVSLQARDVMVFRLGDAPPPFRTACLLTPAPRPVALDADDETP
jgi:hypothetical protein